MGKISAMAPKVDGFITSVVNTATDSTTVYTGAGKIRGVYINITLSNHTVIIKDDSSNMFTIPANSPAGSWFPLGDAEFLTSLVVDPDNSSTGNITVVYNPYNHE